MTECVRQYREAMREFAQMSLLDVWYERINASELVARFGGRLDKNGRIVFANRSARHGSKTSPRAVKKLTESVDGELRFRQRPAAAGAAPRSWTGYQRSRPRTSTSAN